MGVNPDRARTAHHEAAHAVVGYLLGQRLTVVAIVDGASMRGYCRLEPPPGDVDLYRAGVRKVAAIRAGEIGGLLVAWSGRAEPVDDDEAEIAAAIAAALEATTPEVRADVTEAVAANDLERDRDAAAAFARLAGGEEWSAFEAWGAAMARRLVWANVDLIETLAAELLRTPILAGPAAETIIERAIAARKGA